MERHVLLVATMSLSFARPVLVSICVALVACGSSADEEAPPENEVETAPGPAVDTNTPAAPTLPDEPVDPAFDPTKPVENPPDPAKAPPACKKHLTVISTVGVPGASKFKSNGCWTVVITDGAASPNWRKCSTSNFAVGNPNAPNYAYDDTNPDHALTSEKAFLARCAKNATGDGYEFMAYRSGWRLLGATNLRAYFSELYGSAMTDIDSLWFVNGVYRNNAVLAKNKHVYPMINFGPPKASHLEKKLGNDALAICKTVADGGYFGIYNASWREGMPPDDPRLVALENALDTCTGVPKK